MLLIDKNTNMDSVVTMEEANEILTMAKRLYPGFLDGVFLEYSSGGYAYYHDKDENLRIIELIDKDEEDDFSLEKLDETGKKILKYVNSEFNANFALNLKTQTIHAICHEIGHAIDFAKNDFLENYRYEEEIRYEYNYFYSQVDEFKYEIKSLYDFMDEYGIEENEEFIDNWKREIDKMEDQLDYDYRQITSEYKADEFATFFMKTYLRYIPQLFEN